MLKPMDFKSFGLGFWGEICCEFSLEFGVKFEFFAEFSSKFKFELCLENSFDF